MDMAYGTGICEAKQYFLELQRVCSQMPFSDVESVITALSQACEQGRTVFLFGNGGSAALASHLACDLGKGVAHYSPGPRFRALSLVDNVPTMTAWANDASYDEVFAEPLANLLRPQDVALAISGSGNSRNVLRGLEVARGTGAQTIGFTGFKGGKMKALCDLCVIVPSDNMQIIEDLHLAVAHTIFSVMTSRRNNVARAATAAAD